MTTLHILASPYNPVTEKNRMDPFSIAVVKFINHMTQYGWNCIYYGAAGSEVTCENVICNHTISTDKATNVNVYNENAAQEIAKRKHPGDMIVCFYGIENKTACDANSDLISVEPSIGYDTRAVFSNYRAFVSYAQMHMFYGERGMLMSPSWYDAVIPNAITPSEFDYNEHKEDYFLCFGRVMETKGIHIAIQATKAAGKKLVIAGPGSLESLGYNTIPDHVEAVGLCNVEQRRALMKNARAIIGATYYIEPFGNMVAEGYMSGTPAITTDWGGFTETVVQGVTGFRCREFKEFVDAIQNIDSINPKTCRDFAVSNYDDTVVHKKFHNYFEKIQTADFYRL